MMGTIWSRILSVVACRLRATCARVRRHNSYISGTKPHVLTVILLALKLFTPWFRWVRIAMLLTTASRLFNGSPIPLAESGKSRRLSSCCGVLT